MTAGYRPAPLLKRFSELLFRRVGTFSTREEAEEYLLAHYDLDVILSRIVQRAIYSGTSAEYNLYLRWAES